MPLFSGHITTIWYWLQCLPNRKYKTNSSRFIAFEKKRQKLMWKTTFHPGKRQNCFHFWTQIVSFVKSISIEILSNPNTLSIDSNWNYISKQTHIHENESHDFISFKTNTIPCVRDNSMKYCFVAECIPYHPKRKKNNKTDFSSFEIQNIFRVSID